MRTRRRAVRREKVREKIGRKRGEVKMEWEEGDGGQIEGEKRTVNVSEYNI